MNRLYIIRSSRFAVSCMWLVAAAAWLVVAPMARASCPSSFAAPDNYTAGANAFSVAIGDVNGDDKPDLAVANFGNNYVSVLLGNGNGTFAASVNYAAGSGPNSVAIGDLNGDGKPDLAVVNQGNNNVSVLLGNGNGTFAAAVNYAAGSGPNSVAIGDLNGDGKPDLAVTNFYGFGINVSVLLGNGNGTFAAAVNYAANSYPHSVAIGDLNVDCIPDLAVANEDNKVSVLLDNGDGTFSAPVIYGAGSLPFSVAIGDLNGDGRADLAVANRGSNNVSVLLGDVYGTFAAAVNYPAGTTPGSVAIDDLNGDGRPDLATASQSGFQVFVVLNSGPSIGIVQQPASQSVAAGANATFTAIVTGTGPVTYQWRHNGTPIIGAYTNTLTAHNVSAGDAGTYDLQVRGGCNPTAVATSHPATLSIGGGGCRGDFNNDNVFNALDIQAIVNALLAGETCP